MHESVTAFKAHMEQPSSMFQQINSEVHVELQFQTPLLTQSQSVNMTHVEKISPKLILFSSPILVMTEPTSSSTVTNSDEGLTAIVGRHVVKNLRQ